MTLRKSSPARSRDHPVSSVRFVRMPAWLKAKPGGEMQVHGSGALTRWLLENDLGDEMNLLVCPVVVSD